MSNHTTVNEDGAIVCKHCGHNHCSIISWGSTNPAEVYLHLACENGCDAFTFRIKTHKGATYIPGGILS